jgi:hypothetical protein
MPPEQIRIALRTLLTGPHFPAAATLAARRIAAEEPDRTAAEALERTAHPTDRAAAAHDRERSGKSAPLVEREPPHRSPDAGRTFLATSERLPSGRRNACLGRRALISQKQDGGFRNGRRKEA